MAVVENRVTELGDVLVIKTDVPVVGIVSLNSFIDDTVGETESVYFEKLFRYSTNGGLTYSEWMTLSSVNVQNIAIERINYFIIEYRYKAVGAGEVDLAFNSINLGGEVEPLEYSVFQNSPFSKFFMPNETIILKWALNVLEKLYKRGVLPDYIIRNKEGVSDEDFISYWFALTHFFAILVNYARQFDNISSNVFLMREFVKGRGVYMRNNPDTDELYYVYANYIDEIKKRGTVAIARRDGEVDGELVRLLDSLDTDELLFGFVRRGELGWCIGRSSPLYYGADGIVNLIKGYEYTSEIVDISKYPLREGDDITVSGGHFSLCSSQDDVVIGRSFWDEEYVFRVDPSLSYEISFKIKGVSGLNILDFGLTLFDQNHTIVNASKVTDGSSSNYFFTSKGINRTNQEYWVRGVLFKYNTPLISGDTLNIGFGQNLRSTINTCYMVPYIRLRNNASTVRWEIWDIKIRPASLWFSRGALSPRNFIISYLRNRNTENDNSQVKEIIEQELIPYNSHLLTHFLP